MFPDKSLVRDNKKIVILNKVKNSIKKQNSPILIEGFTPGMSIHLSSCCAPIPGDSVRAHVVAGKGFTIHQSDCDELNKIKSETIDVSWEKLNITKSSFLAKISVTLKNEVGALGDLSSNIGKNKSNIRNLKITERSNMFFNLNIDIDVSDINHLKKILVSLRTSPNIINVHRMK